MLELAIFWTAFFGLALLLAVCLAFLIEAMGWEQPWMPRESFDEEHGYRERVGL